MKPNRVLSRMSLAAGLALLAAGCSGINTSHSVSPASFLLPGLLYHAPPPALLEPLTNSVSPRTLAQVLP